MRAPPARRGPSTRPSCASCQTAAATTRIKQQPAGMWTARQVLIPGWKSFINIKKYFGHVFIFLKIWTVLKRAQHVFLNVETTWSPFRMSPANCSAQVEIIGLLLWSIWPLWISTFSSMQWRQLLFILVLSRTHGHCRKTLFLDAGEIV